MFENLLNCFTPLATAYNTLVVVKSAFQQFDVNKHCSSKETHQTERAQNAFAYNPYAGVHQEDLFTSNSEDDFNLVTLKMENDVDTDYCLVETQSGNSSAAATALEDGAPAAGFSAEASPAFYVSLIDSAYDVASAAEKSGSIQPDLKGLVVDIGLNIAMNTTNPATYTSTSDPSRTKTNRFDTDIGIEFDVNSDLNSYPAQNDSNGYGANIGVAIGLNYTPSTTDLPSETAQSHAKGFGADLDIDFGLNTTASAPGQPEKKT
ncbi:hypothetical protein HMPREF1544_08450 [Mucor circinelloides 1006PhL]|uniref:Uncharacterized protein n=1 Tax=Mucor circinelloides f. circinelloides (strain 1006PhL) TaxID=1220926 RepID=S2J8S4_MUCC1|nr:hypothetical protein HMPREF1544_08450 [Mucor circinelloides 1006PhL]KAG1103875.1 hypothetical protein G6F42_017166 [Rhizopus arrhizus]